jgi:hypothetical protein
VSIILARSARLFKGSVGAPWDAARYTANDCICASSNDRDSQIWRPSFALGDVTGYPALATIKMSGFVQCCIAGATQVRLAVGPGAVGLVEALGCSEAREGPAERGAVAVGEGVVGDDAFDPEASFPSGRTPA